MIPDTTNLSQVIDQLAMNIISLEPDDVMALGTILQQVEEVEKITEDPELGAIQGFCPPLKTVIEKFRGQSIFRHEETP